MRIERLLRMRQVSAGIQILEPFVREGIPGFEFIKNTRLDGAVQYTQRVLDNAIIFCDFHSEMRFIEKKLSKTTNKKIGVLHGGISTSNSEALENQTDYDILIVQIYAGGTRTQSSKFQQCNHPHYNPFIEEQEIGRVHRDGQARCHHP